MAERRIGRYQVLDRIAAGGQATVYRARDTDLGRVVALKVLHPHLSEDAQFRERFLREARMAAAITHPNVVVIHEIGEDSGSHYIAMEFLPSSLDQLLKDRGRLPVPEATEIVRQIGRALQAAHNAGVIHRDLKPLNILLTQDGDAKVADFGIARAAEFSVMTATGMVMGTPQYMSPEQAQGEDVDARSDLYSLGVMFYEMVTGRAPFANETPQSVMRHHLQGTPVPLDALQTLGVSAEASRVIGRALAIDKTERYQSATDLVADLSEPALRTEPAPRPVAPPPRPPVAPREPASHRPAGGGHWRGRIGKALVGVMAVFAILVVIGLLDGEEDVGSNGILNQATIPIVQVPPATVPTTTSLPHPTPRPQSTPLPASTPTPGPTSTAIPSSAPVRTVGTVAPVVPNVTTAPTPSPTPETREVMGLDLAGTIAYVAQRDGNAEIYRIRADGTEDVRLTKNAVDDWDPDWTRDGDRIAFVSARGDGDEEIYMMQSDGTQQTQLTFKLGNDWLPSWSPGGSHLAFTSNNNGHDEIHTMLINGNQYTNLSESINDEWDPDWSGDQTRIVFTTSQDDGDSELYVMQADGTNRTRLTSNESDDHSPSWSPDSTRILYTSEIDGLWEIMVMTAEGTEVTRLTKNDSNDFSPAWSPDGSHIAFVSDRDGNDEIYLMQANGAKQTRLTSNSTDDGQPSWTLAEFSAAFAVTPTESTSNGTKPTVVFGFSGGTITSFNNGLITVKAPVGATLNSIDLGYIALTETEASGLLAQAPTGTIFGSQIFSIFAMKDGTIDAEYSFSQFVEFTIKYNDDDLNQASGRRADNIGLYVYNVGTAMWKKITSSTPNQIDRSFTMFQQSLGTYALIIKTP